MVDGKHGSADGDHQQPGCSRWHSMTAPMSSRPDDNGNTRHEHADRLTTSLRSLHRTPVILADRAIALDELRQVALSTESGSAAFGPRRCHRRPGGWQPGSRDVA